VGWRRKSVRQVLIYPATSPVIDQVQPKTPAAAAGLQHGDIVLGYDATPIYSPIALAAYVETHAGKPISLAVDRNGQKLNVTVTPQLLANEKTPRIGIAWDTSGRMSIAHPNPIEQIYNSVTSTLDTIGAVASPKSDVKLQHLSGRSEFSGSTTALRK
jgi:regulator of sigma E protease